MNYNIEYLPIAKKDIIDIVAYIHKKLCNPTAAERLAKKIIDGIDGLQSSPYSYPIYYNAKPMQHEYRKLLIDNYLVFYWVNENEKTITIARVIYARRAYNALLK